MNTTRMIVTTVCLLFASQSLAAETPTVIAKTSKASVQVADPFSLDMTVSAPVGSKVTFPPTGPTLGEFDVRATHDTADIPSAESSDLRTWTRRMTLESIATGDLEVPALEVQVTSDGKSQTIRSQPLRVHVASVLEDRSDPTQFRDIESVVDFTVPIADTSSLTWWAVAGFGLLAVALATGIAGSRRDKWVTPKQWALERLDALAQGLQTPSAESDTSTGELSSIVCNFLLMQFEILESGCTGQELLKQLASQQRLDEVTVNHLGELFTLADRAKFAGWRLSPTRLQHAIKDSRRLIEKIDLAQRQPPLDPDQAPAR